MSLSNSRLDMSLPSVKSPYSLTPAAALAYRTIFASPTTTVPYYNPAAGP